MFGFINMSRQFPDGRDLNRVFLEAKRVFSQQICLPYFNRNNALLTMQSIFMQEAQVQRTSNSARPNSPELKELADVFNAPFTLFSKNIAGSLGIPVRN
jgi:hypothetical protein